MNHPVIRLFMAFRDAGMLNLNTVSVIKSGDIFKVRLLHTAPVTDQEPQTAATRKTANGIENIMLFERAQSPYAIALPTFAFAPAEETKTDSVERALFQICTDMKSIVPDTYNERINTLRPQIVQAMVMDTPLPLAFLVAGMDQTPKNVLPVNPTWPQRPLPPSGPAAP